MTNFTDDENRLIDDCFQLIKDLVREAGEVVKQGYFKAIDAVEIKEKVAKWDMVTEYDHKVEKFLLNGIKQKYPSHK